MMMMKAALVTLGLMLVTACSDDAATNSAVKDDSAGISLAGKTYSRTFYVEPIFGQPGGTRTHSLVFAADGMTVSDNADTFFGNPPSTYSYELIGGIVAMRQEGGRSESYALSADGKTLTGTAGAVLTLEEDAVEQLKTVDLQEQEIQAAIRLFNRVSPPLVGDSVCTEQTVVVSSRVISFNPARWTVSFGTTELELTRAEISDMIALFDRAEVPAVRTNGIVLESTATLKSAVCGFNPARWTLSFAP